MSRPRAGAFLTLSGLLVAVVIASCGGGSETVEVAEELEVGGGGAITIFTDRTELFFEYPPLVAGEPGEPWAIHLTNLADFQPVTTGRLTLEFEAPDGQLYTDVTDEPARAGVYSPAPSLPAPGMYDLVVVLEGSQVSDEIFVGPVRVFASVDDLPVLPPAESVGISFLKEQQWPIDFATVPARSRVVSPGLEVTGEFVPAPGAVAEITAPVSGILRWDLNRAAPAEGDLVRQGQPLVRLSPVAGEGAFASLVAQAEDLEREVERAERLLEAEAIPARRLVEARHRLDVVRAQLAAVDAEGGDDYTLVLNAPIGGSVVQRGFVTGERVEAGQPLLRLIDSRSLQLLLYVPASHAGSLDGIVGSTFTVEGSDHVHRTDALVSVGAALDPVRRTLPVRLAVSNPTGALKAGMLVNARILSGAPEPALAVPSEGIVDEDGLLVAYVQIGGESFERRAVTIGATDGQWTTVLSGVRRGERVVIRGQYQIKLGSLNTSEISDHGHPH